MEDNWQSLPQIAKILRGPSLLFLVIASVSSSGRYLSSQDSPKRKRKPVCSTSNSSLDMSKQISIHIRSPSGHHRVNSEMLFILL